MKNTVLAASTFLWSFGMVCFGEVNVKVPADAEVIIKKWAENRDKLKSYVMKLEMDSTYNVKTSDPSYAPFNGIWKQYNMQEMGTDGDRYYLKDWRWGADRRRGREISKANARYNSRLYNGDKTYFNGYSTLYPKKPDKVTIYSGGNETFQKDALCRGIKCHAAFGYFEGDLNTRIDKLLEGSDVKMQAQDENANGYSCRVITADTSHGEYKLWFAPENGYSIVKAIKTVQGGDIHNGHATKKGYSNFATIDIVKMVEINRVWIPTEIHFNGKSSYANGDSSQAKHISKINTVNLDPDHELLKSFEIDGIRIRNGARVSLNGKRKIEYTWQDGKVVDKDGKVIMDAKAGKAIK